MTKLGKILLSFWVILAIIHIVGLFVGLNVFFVICNDIFGIMNGFVVLGLIPLVIEYIKDRRE